MCVYDLYRGRGPEDWLKCSPGGTGWEWRREIVKSPELRVALLFCIITRALESSRAQCHPSSGRRTSNPGEGARNCFSTDRLPSFCPREGQMEEVSGGAAVPSALLQSVSPKLSDQRAGSSLAKMMSHAGARW